MFTGNQFRAKAAECAEKAKNTNVPSEIGEFQRSTQAFTELAQNEDWLEGNFDKIIRSRDVGAPSRVIPAAAPPWRSKRIFSAVSERP